MTAQPTGRIESGDRLVLTRLFRAPIAEIWAAVTDAERLARWYGTWSGDPSSGRVEVRMTAEDQAEPETLVILRCDPPHHLAMTLGESADAWRVDVDLHENPHEGDGMVTLRLTHWHPDPAELASVGPGWDYYLDRLVAAETGGDVDAVDFGRDYHPAMTEHYRALADELQVGG
ncbi:hypothetical protein GCM10011374_32800 [Kocuria dechangensis]|jgi:uncharacterized protein YndB with AHSA1/START domain|uniref:Activator of Hsp90 ATPase homologue 1/2-like C-terminal domain-containing protein n=1 Tax=Kocuria dechangensis TaxID=1176249 RepID=A0A917H3G0_9MICC|nr:SRPBCC family protein [Kocuria dechangensis]GGG66200.1 hypothetical protein GCM10011374_32800 [Kocuria dechangensis]